MNLIAIPLRACPHINVGVLIAFIDIGNSCKADILSRTADNLATDRIAVLSIATDVSSIAFGVLTCAAATHILIVSYTTESARDDNLGTVQLTIQFFQLTDKLIGKLKIMRLTALAI